MRRTPLPVARSSRPGETDGDSPSIVLSPNSLANSPGGVASQFQRQFGGTLEYNVSPLGIGRVGPLAGIGGAMATRTTVSGAGEQQLAASRPAARPRQGARRGFGAGGRDCAGRVPAFHDEAIRDRPGHARRIAGRIAAGGTG